MCRKKTSIVVQLDPSSLSNEYLVVRQATYLNESDLKKLQSDKD